MKTKTLKDSFGSVEIAFDKDYGIQTQRAYNNFSLHDYHQPIEVIKALLIIKAAAAKANLKLKQISKKKANLIYKEALTLEKVVNKNDGNFPLSIFQSGSGTQSNMNVNEVLVGRIKRLHEVQLHPNNDINMSQSSNDTFPCAMNISSYILIGEELLPSLKKLIKSFKKKEEEFKGKIKLGRTHLMDAVPISFSQEISGFIAMLSSIEEDLEKTSKKLLSTALGGTAVGTGINTPKNFDKEVHKEISKLTGYNFKPAKNKFKELSSHQEIVKVSSLLKILALDLIKIGNDLRWSGAGPSGGINELLLPENEQGSSIMPGKVNPSAVESMTMVCAKVIGNDTTISFAESQGSFQLNVYKPLIVFSFIESIKILTSSMNDFRIHCLDGIKVNEEIAKKHLDESYMVITALNSKIGYDNGAKIVKHAKEKKITLQKAAEDLDLLNKEDFEKLANYKKMI